MNQQTLSPRRVQAAGQSSDLAAQFIVDAVGDVARPHANVARPGTIAHIPGNSSFLAFLWGMRAMITHGNAYYVDQVARYGPIYIQRDGEGEAVFVADPDAVAA